jgi:competence protein ComEC
MFRLLNSKTKGNILILLFVVAVVVWIFVFVENSKKEILEIDFFDVGQGDGIFIEIGDGKQMLVDGGPSNMILEKLGKEMRFYDRYIDLIVLTHPEYDHINGLIEVIRRYNIGAIIATGVVRETNAYKEWVKIIEQKNIPIYIAQLGGQIDFGNNIKMDILYPFESLVGQEVSNTNNSSIVGKLVYKDFELLLTGDIEKSVERKLINSNINLQADVLKVPHHGSKSSSTEEFLKAVDSVLNIIQAGKDNKYGHPHEEVLARMAKDVFVTGKDGDLEVFSNGKDFSIDR